jgi:ubiquitin thioesterase protein OTUB1
MEDVQPPVASQAPLHVNLAGYNSDFVPMSRGMSDDVMTLIPGLYPTGIGQTWPSVSSYDFHTTPVPQMTPVSSYAPVPVSASSQEYTSPVHPNVPLDPPINIPLNPTMSIERGGPFRPSVYELEPGFHSGQAPLQFQTSIFRK